MGSFSHRAGGSSQIVTAAVVALLTAGLSAAPAAQTTKGTESQPPTAGEPFYLSTSTGRLLPLEKVKSWVLKRPRGVAFFVEGGESPVAIPAGEFQTFLFRAPAAPRPDDAARQFRLEVLTSEGTRRFVTGTNVPFDVRNSGQAYRLTPRVPLPAGEYAFSSEGLFGVESSGYQGREGWAFRVIEK